MEERVSKLKYRSTVTTKYEQKDVKTEQTLRDLWNIKWSKIYVIGIPEGKERMEQNIICISKFWKYPKFNETKKFTDTQWGSMNIKQGKHKKTLASLSYKCLTWII